MRGLVRGRGLAAALAWGAALMLSSAEARGQERTAEPQDDRPGPGSFEGAGTPANLLEERLGSDEAWRKAPPSPYDPTDEAPPPEGTRPQPPPPPTPESHAAQPGAPSANPSFLDSLETHFDGKMRLELGYDSNVFRSERGHTGDGFFHGFGEANALVRFPGERELFANVTAEGFSYLHDQIADEMYASNFLDYYHPVSPLLDLDVQNTLEYSRQNLLDDNGDLLPREKYDAFDEEMHAAAIAHLSEQLSWDVGGGFRYKNFEETHGLPSLDFQEIRGDTGLRYKIPWWSDGRLKVRYIFRERQYYDFPASQRNGTTSPDDPKLELRRHQVRTSYSQKLDIFDMLFTAVAGYTFTYNQDTYENDRSYREHALSGRIEWWVVKEWTRLEVELRGGTRSFLVRRTLVDTALKQRFLDCSVLVWQKLIDHVSLVGEVGWYIYHSTDLRESYGRLLVQGGVEASF